MSLSSTTLFHLLNIIFSNEIDYFGLVYFLHHISSTEISVKLEVAKRLHEFILTKPIAAKLIAKQIGWQESISRLLIRKAIASPQTDDDDRRKSFGINADVLLNNSNDLISFSDEQITIDVQSDPTLIDDNSNKDEGQIITDLQASVTEAATVIEAEIKGMYVMFFKVFS